MLKEVGKPIAGKTGTTNDEKDAWFIGFSPDLVVGIYVGFDKPRNLGRGMTGGHLAAPRTSSRLALADKPAVPFKVPPASSWSASTPRRHAAGPARAADHLEAFKPGAG